MNNIAEELRDIADKAEAGDKLHWAKAMRAGALQLDNWQRDIETYRLRLDHHDAQSAQLGGTVVTREMIGAAHDIMLERGDFVLSAVLLEKIYLAMESKKP